MPKDKHRICCVNHEDIYIADWKNSDRSRGVRISHTPQEVESVHVCNGKRIPVVFDGFADNALPGETAGDPCSQCECLLFPDTANPDHWILFVETKYAKDWHAAFKKEFGYPNCMVSQIIKTVDYFRGKKIIGTAQKVSALVAFPNLIDDFNDTLFDRLEKERSIENIKLQYNITIRGCNSAKIISAKRLRLGEIS